MYQALARRCLQSLIPVEPLAQADEARARFTAAMLQGGDTASELGLKPLVELKRS